MRYKTPNALEMAIKDAARRSSQDTGKAIAGFYFDRFLCRIFSNENSAFILKGGQSLLARAQNARSTRDIDLLAQSSDLDEALEKLRQLASIDLDDHIHFEYINHKPIRLEDEHRRGYNITFQPYLGVTPMPTIAVDLVIDQAFYGDPISLKPKHRLPVKDLEVYDYLVCPIENSIADKLYAIAQDHNGIPSSRMKDFVDLIFIATTQTFESDTLFLRIQEEAIMRKTQPATAVEIPPQWLTTLRGTYTSLIRECGLTEKFPNIEAGFEFVSGYLNPIIQKTTTNKTWNPNTFKWE